MTDNTPAKGVTRDIHAANGSTHGQPRPDPVIPKFMSAVAFNRYGGPEVLEPILAVTPKPSSEQVLIRVRAAGVNPVDYRMRNGELRWVLPGGFPRIPGCDIAGAVS